MRAALLHETVWKYGTVYNIVAPGMRLAGATRKAAPLSERVTP